MTGSTGEGGRRAAGARAALALPLLAASAVAGCARDRGPLRADGVTRSPTVGRDLRAAPRGVTVPAASLGVDLVGRPPGGPGAEGRDREAVLAGFAASPR